MGEALKHTPIHTRHVEAGARMVPFAGWHMPVLYSSIVEEHRSVRRSAGLFDVSHMGELRIRGPQAAALAQLLLSNDVVHSPVGRVRYGLMCQADGGVIDDVTAYRAADDDVLLCVNASNIAADLDWVRKVHGESGLDCEVQDESDATALLAIQGPAALEITAGLVLDDDPPPRRWRFRPASLAGVPVWLSRTGYTGEDGYEIFAPAQQAGAVWDALVAAGGERLCLAGLGARDTLRTEMAFPLYGHELDLERNPLEAGLERFVRFGAGFIGEPALEALRAGGPAQRLAGLLLEGRAVPRPGFPILGDGPVRRESSAVRSASGAVGLVTSGTFAPSVERSIAMGYVPADLAEPGTRLAVEIRGQRVPCTVTETPFYNRKS